MEPIQTRCQFCGPGFIGHCSHRFQDLLAKEPHPDAPTDIDDLPDYWDERRGREGKPDLSRCAAELRVALRGAGDKYHWRIALERALGVESDALNHTPRWALQQVSALRNRCEGGACPPVPMLLWCPDCGTRHVDRGEFATKWHHTHACQDCGHVWRPAVVPTVGVKFLPGFKNEEPDVIDPVWALLEQWKKTRGTLWTTQIAELETAFFAQKAGAP